MSGLSKRTPSCTACSAALYPSTTAGMAFSTTKWVLVLYACAGGKA